MIRAVRKIKETFIESEGCKEVIINTTDRTPPDAPTGLIAIPTQREIMLKWNENKESDLKGYILYRKSAGEADFKRLLTTLLTRASYLDRSVTRGEPYTYAVTAIDDASKANESEFSEEVTLEYHY
jgi:fibronectin type 3 domain-containing protein